MGGGPDAALATHAAPSLGQVRAGGHGAPAAGSLRQQAPVGMQLVPQAKVPAGHASMLLSTVAKRTVLDGGLAAVPRRHETLT